jgi:hypothetical protein
VPVDAEFDIFAAGSDLAADLASANGFTAEELAANRAARIAPSQIRKLWSAALDPVRTSLYALLGWLLFLLIVKTFVPLKLFAMIEWALGMSLYVLFALVTVSTVLAFLFQALSSIWVVLDLLRDIFQGEAIVKEGRVSTSSSAEKLHGMQEMYGDKEDRFGYAIGNEILTVNEAAYKVLRPYSDSSCRVYMTPRSKLLLSIEPVKIRRTDRIIR